MRLILTGRLRYLEMKKLLPLTLESSVLTLVFHVFNADLPLFQVIRQAPHIKYLVHPLVEQCHRILHHQIPIRLLCTQFEVPIHSRIHMHR